MNSLSQLGKIDHAIDELQKRQWLNFIYAYIHLSSRVSTRTSRVFTRLLYDKKNYGILSFRLLTKILKPNPEREKYNNLVVFSENVWMSIRMILGNILESYVSAAKI